MLNVTWTSRIPALNRRIGLTNGARSKARERGRSIKTRMGRMECDNSHINLAHRLADEAGRITAAAFRQPMDIVDKSDRTPVTEIDRGVEQKLRSIIHEAMPDHSIFGEEYGLTVNSGVGKRYLWVIDPIDGTRSFITGKPLFGTLIALLYDGRPVLGIIDQPILNDRWIGIRGRPTMHNGCPVAVRQCKNLRDAYIYSTTPDMFPGDKAVPYGKLKSNAKDYLYGADCYAYGLLSLGLVDVVFEADMKIFDYAPMVPIIEGAGGVITDWTGEALYWDGVKDEGAATWKSTVLAVGDPSLHKDILHLFGDASE